MHTPVKPQSRPLLELFKAAIFLLLLSPFHRAALADGAPVSTHFSYNAPNATTVGLAGEFNSWQPVAMTKGADGAWTADVPLAPGEYGYKFVVDGNDWEIDPNNASRKTVDGVENSSITVTGTMAAPAASAAPSTTGTGTGATAPASGNGALFTYSNPTAGSVFLAGQFNGWNTSATPMQKDASGTWSVQVPLSPGNYQYKLFVDGAWMLDPGNSQQADDGTGNKNSVKVVGSDSSAPAAAPSASPSTSP
jgi:1,4-alpha-glucan branching enzyme